MGWRQRDPDDPDSIYRVLSHPLRVKILAELHKVDETSPRECADMLGLPLSNISYHFRVLGEYNCVEQTRTRQVRGSVQHFYRAGSAWKDHLKRQITDITGLDVTPLEIEAMLDQIRRRGGEPPAAAA